MKKLLVFTFILCSKSIFSQTTLFFKDSISKKPSAFVMIFNEKNELIETSNELGKIHFKSTNKLANTIFIKSIFYEKKEILVNELINNKTILLKPLVNVLDEVEIKIAFKKYAILTAYYRIYNLIDDVLNSFVDAEIKYIINNNSIQKKVINFRIFDTIPIDEYKLKSKNPYFIPNLEHTSLFEKLNSKFNLIKNNEDGFINIIGKEDKKVYGTIKKDLSLKNNSNIKIDIIKNSKHFDGIKLEKYFNKELLRTTIKDLKYRNKEKIRNIIPEDIKRNPMLKGKKTFFNKREIFIQSFEYVSKDEYKRIKKMEYKNNSISHYTREFWKDLDNYTPLSPSTEKQIKDILVERK